MSKAPYARGFATLEKETHRRDVPVQGRLPSWLSGTLVRNGPAKFEVGTQAYRHWFDGLAMLHAFAFHNGRVAYTNRFLESQSYLEAKAKGRISRGEFGTAPHRSLFGRIVSVFAPRRTDNASVSINMLADRYVALTEAPVPIMFDPGTLRTLGPFPCDKQLIGQLSTAHPHFDFDSRESFENRTEISRKCLYHIFATRSDNARVRRVTSVGVDQPAYMHSFAMTRQYVILVEFPLVVKPLALALSGKPFVDNFIWQPGRATRFRVVRKDDGQVVATCESDACFSFHHVNAFEEGDEAFVDLVAYPDASNINALYLDAIRSGTDFTPGELRRYRLKLASGAVTHEPLVSDAIEFPRLNYRACNGNPYRYVFGTGNRLPRNFMDQLVKVDVQERTTTTWCEPDCYPGEPVFVASPDARDESDGVILSVVLDGRKGVSFLLVLDARSFTELARAEVPHHIPFGLHGQYFERSREADPRRHLHR